MKKWQDIKEEVLIFVGLFIFEPILIVFEIFGERVDKLFKSKKCGDAV